MVGGVSFGQEAPTPDQRDAQKTIEETVDDFKKFDLEKISEVVKAFLSAGTVTERVKYVRDPKRVLPLMKTFYGAEKFKAEGFESLDKFKVSFRGEMLTSIVEMGDYLTAPIAIERMAGKSDVYRVDWESWVGYCEMKIEVMKKDRPVEPVMVRTHSRQLMI